MSNIIATVDSINGEAVARGPEGDRPLQVGDPIFENEVLITGAVGDVTLMPGDGSADFYVPPGQIVAMMGDVDVEDAATPENIASVIEEFGGHDVFDPTDPPALGVPSGGGGGHDFVRLARVIEETTPASANAETSASWVFPRAAGEPDDGHSGDGDGGDTPPPLPAVIGPDAYIVTEGERVVFGTDSRAPANILDNDSNLGGNLHIQSVFDADGSEIQVPLGGSVVITGALGAEIRVYSDGRFEYVGDVPVRDHGNNGHIDSDGSDDDHFQYTAGNIQGGISDPANVVIHIEDTVPTANNDNYGSIHYTGGNLPGLSVDAANGVIQNDVGSEDEPSVVASVRNSDGTSVTAVNGETRLVLNCVDSAGQPVGGEVYIHPDGSFDYYPLRDGRVHVGTVSFQYQLVDSDGSLSDWVTVTFDLTLAPEPVPVTIDVIEGDTVTGDLTSNGETVTSVTLPDGTVVVVPPGGVDIPTDLGGNIHINPDGTYEYEAPPTRDNGPGSDTDGPDIDTIVVHTEKDGKPSGDIAVNFDIKDTVPVAEDDHYYVPVGGTVLIPAVNGILLNDTTSQDDPHHIDVTDTDGNVVSIPVVVAPDGTLILQPTTDVTVPTTSGGTAIIHTDGTLEYTAQPGLVPGDSDGFDYTLVDRDGSTDDASVSICIGCPPNFNTNVDAGTIVEGTTINNIVDVLPAFADADGNPLSRPTVVSVLDPATGNTILLVDGVAVVNFPSDQGGGTATVHANGRVDYTADVRDHGNNAHIDSDGPDAVNLTVNVQDGIVTAPVNVHIDIVDTVPVARGDHYGEFIFTGGTNPGLSVDAANGVLRNDTVSRDDPTVVAFVRPSSGGDVQAVQEATEFSTERGGTVVINPDGSFDYFPPRVGVLFVGSDSFQYQLVDGDGSPSSWVTVDFAVTAPGPGPVDPGTPCIPPVPCVPGLPVIPVLPGVPCLPPGLICNPEPCTPILPPSVPCVPGFPIPTLPGVVPCPEFTLPVCDPFPLNPVCTPPSCFVPVCPPVLPVCVEPVVPFCAPLLPLPLINGGCVPQGLLQPQAFLCGTSVDHATVVADYDGTTVGHNGKAETFVWTADDASPDAATSTISHFNPVEGDNLDLRDLLEDESGAFNFDSQHLNVSSDGCSTTITVTPVDANVGELNIVLEGVDLTCGITNQDAIINSLLNHNILVDDK